MPPNWGRPGGGEPGIVFGAREKLRADGPFLAMLHEFATWLRDTDHLIVVGYSFRDRHIDVLIREWLEGIPERHMTIIDPRFPKEIGSVYKLSKFAKWLEEGVLRGGGWEVVDGKRRPVDIVQPGFSIYNVGAEEVLEEVCRNAARF